MKVKLTGVLSKPKALRKVGNIADDVLDDEVLMAAIDTGNIARKSIQRGVKTGTTYQKYNPRRTHRASASGQAPATDTGALVSSITHEKKGHAEALVGSTINYSKFLEFGTRDMDERPFLKPALKEAAKNFEDKLFDRMGGKRTRINTFIRKG